MATRIPEGMSSLDVFNALYRNGKVLGMGVHNPAAGVIPFSQWNAVQVFKTYCPTGYCDYVRGKYMKVDFSEFPKLDGNSYDKYYGAGAAQKAIDSYAKTMAKQESTETFDLNSKPCTYFTLFWKQRTPESHRKDLDQMFTKCEGIQKAEEEVEEYIKERNPSSVFNQCKVRYGLVSPPFNYVGHNFKPCQEALDHFKMLLQSKRFDDTNVADFSVCKYNPYFPFFKRCKTFSGEISLDSARRLTDT